MAQDSTGTFEPRYRWQMMGGHGCRDFLALEMLTNDDDEQGLGFPPRIRGCGRRKNCPLAGGDWVADDVEPENEEFGFGGLLTPVNRGDGSEFVVTRRCNFP